MSKYKTVLKTQSLGRLIHNLAKTGVFLYQRAPKKALSDDDFEMTLLPFQLSKYQEVDFENKTIEQQVAFKALQIYLADCTSISVFHRRKSIAEIYRWMNDDAREAAFNPGRNGFDYKFGYWCEQLGVDAGYMKRKLKTFLTKCWKDAKIGASHGQQ